MKFAGFSQNRWFITGLVCAALALQSVAVAQTSSGATMSGPMRITDSPLGLFVGDYVGQKLVVVDPETLATIDTVPLTGKPMGVVWMNDLVYVGDERSGTIAVYESSGDKKNNKNLRNPKKVVEWVQVAADLTGFVIGGPSDIVADESTGWLFVASVTDQVVYVLDESGALVRTIGGSDSADPLGKPQGLALDRAGQRIYVVDGGPRNCGSFGSCFSEVRVFNYLGDSLGLISGKSQPENFRFSRAQGLTVDSFGDVYLVDSWRGQVLVFEEAVANSWTGIGTFGSKGSGVKQLLLPMDVVVEIASSTIYVTNSMKGRVEVFSFGDMVQ
jgi:DNA-binding beta-propeller fold protein YncE